MRWNYDLPEITETWWADAFEMTCKWISEDIALSTENRFWINKKEKKFYLPAARLIILDTRLNFHKTHDIL